MSGGRIDIGMTFDDTSTPGTTIAVGIRAEVAETVHNTVAGWISDIRHRLMLLRIEEHTVRLTWDSDLPRAVRFRARPVAGLTVDREFSEWETLGANLCALCSWLNVLVLTVDEARIAARDAALAQWSTRDEVSNG